MRPAALCKRDIGRATARWHADVPDKEHHAIVLFSAGDTFRQPSPDVTGFKGAGKVLRDFIVPSLPPLQ
ncbi:MAG TPA: hypothetical protein VFJ47_03570 [Terriglobales bacterium]|nr:hypothetical protein [Terriglobales bacterium]